MAEENLETSPVVIDSSPLLLPKDHQEAKKVFNSLPIENQLDIVLRAQGKSRLHYLFLSEHPEELVERFPELEVFLTVKEVGEKDSLDLIALTTPEQFQYLLDLELWKKDQINPEKVLHWMEILLESGEERVIQFVRETDPEWIALILKKLLRVITLEGEPLENRDRIPLFTLDQYYFIDFKGKESRAILASFLEIFYRVNSDEYRRVMESLIWELESELEETGYRLRNARMADYGFLSFEEALDVYGFVDPNSLAMKESSRVIDVPKETEKRHPTVYLTFRGEGPFFSSMLSKIEDSRKQSRLQTELASLCNKAMMAEPLDLFEIDEMKRVIQKVFHYLNLGLQCLSHEQEVRAVEALHSIPLEKIFQGGVGATLLLRKKAESILKGPWFLGDRETLILLDPPYQEKFEGVLKKRPVLYEEGKWRDFKDIRDVKEIENFLETIEVVANFFVEQLHVNSQSVKGLYLAGCHPEEWKGITLSTIFLTALSNRILKGTFKFEAIEKSRLKELFAHMFMKDEKRRGVVKMEIRDGLSDWLSSIEEDENKRQHLMAFRDFCLDLIEEEYGSIPPEEEIDPRFVKGLLMGA